MDRVLWVWRYYQRLSFLLRARRLIEAPSRRRPYAQLQPSSFTIRKDDAGQSVENWDVIRMAAGALVRSTIL